MLLAAMDETADRVMLVNGENSGDRRLRSTIVRVASRNGIAQVWHRATLARRRGSRQPVFCVHNGTDLVSAWHRAIECVTGPINRGIRQGPTAPRSPRVGRRQITPQDAPCEGNEAKDRWADEATSHLGCPPTSDKGRVWPFDRSTGNCWKVADVGATG